MSLLDRIKSLFGASSSQGADARAEQAHAGNDHAADDHSHEPVAPPAPPADPTGLPSSEPATSEEGEDGLP
jgi:hypothetical protein